MTTEHTSLNRNEGESHINFLYALLKKRIYSHPAVVTLTVCESPSIDKYSDYRISIYVDPNKVANVTRLPNHEYKTVCNSLLDKVDDIVRPLLMFSPEDSTYPGIGPGEDVSIDYFLTVDQVRSLMELYPDGQFLEESGTRSAKEPYIITKEDIPDRQRFTKEVKDTVDRATHNYHLYAIQYESLNHSMSHFMNILKQVVRELRNNGKNGDILFPLTNEVYFTYDGFDNDVKIPYHFTHLKWSKDDKVTLEGCQLLPEILQKPDGTCGGGEVPDVGILTTPDTIYRGIGIRSPEFKPVESPASGGVRGSRKRSDVCKDRQISVYGDYLDTGGDKDEAFTVSFTFVKLPTEVIIDVIRELGFLFW